MTLVSGLSIRLGETLGQFRFSELQGAQRSPAMITLVKRSGERFELGAEGETLARLSAAIANGMSGNGNHAPMPVVVSP